MAVKVQVIIPLMASLLLAGCSQAGPVTTTPQVVTTPSATPTVAGATLLETCPQVESVIMTLSGFPTGAEWTGAQDEVQTLSDAGDLEAQNALTGLLASMETLMGEPTGTELLDARKSNRDALSDLAGRCKTVGSSALQ